MKKHLVRAAVVACLLGSAAIVAPAMFVAPAFAAAAASGPGVSAPVGKILSDAQKAYQANDIAGGLTLSKQAQALPNRTPFDDYMIDKMLAYGAIKSNDLATAYTVYLAMVDSPAMPDADKAETYRITTLLATQSKHYDVAVKYGPMAVAASPTPDVSLLVSLAQAYYDTNDYANAAAMAQKGIAATPAGTPPNQALLEITMGTQIKQKQMDAAMATLEQIVTYYDDPDEWNQYIGVSLGVKGIKDYEVLDICRLRFPTKAGTSPDDLVTCASVAQSVALPVEADAYVDLGGGKVPQSATISKIHADAARDRATLTSFAGLAAKSANGELDAKLAETYFGYGRYDDVIATAHRAIQKGGAKVNVEQMNMLIAMSLAVQGKTADATAAFNAVSGSTAGFAKAKHIWLTYLNRKSATASAAPAPAPAH